MADETYSISVEADNVAASGTAAQVLADTLREADGVLEVTRAKTDNRTMDLGTIVAVVASSGATLAIARGLAAWLRGQRGVTVRVERDGRTGSVKAAVAGINPEAAARIIETVVTRG